jgi:hypothetical protein
VASRRGFAANAHWPARGHQLAYGYRDSGFFFLKIKAAFPGNL